MQATRFAVDVRSITDLKQRASKIVDHARKTRRPVLFTRHGRGIAVLLSVEEFESLNDRAAFIQAVGEGGEAARTGDLHPNDETTARPAPSVVESCERAHRTVRRHDGDSPKPLRTVREGPTV